MDCNFKSNWRRIHIVAKNFYYLIELRTHLVMIFIEAARMCVGYYDP